MIEFTEGYHTYYVYIITNKYRSTYYTGVTNNLSQRFLQHHENIAHKRKTLLPSIILNILFTMRNFLGYNLPLQEKKKLKVGEDIKN